MTVVYINFRRLGYGKVGLRQTNPKAVILDAVPVLVDDQHEAISK